MRKTSFLPLLVVILVFAEESRSEAKARNSSCVESPEGVSSSSAHAGVSQEQAAPSSTAAAPLTPAVPAGQGEELWCYKCENELTPVNCEHLQKCATYDTYCVTSVMHGESGEHRFSKGCSPHCSEQRVNVLHPITIFTQCCNQTFCNSIRSESTVTKSNRMILNVGVLASLLYIFRSGL